MALFFELYVEFSRESGDSAACEAHFFDWVYQGEDLDLHSRVRTLTRNDGSYGVVVYPSGLSESGIHSAEDAAAMSAAGHALLQSLKDCSGYQFALVGIEVSDMLGIGDLAETMLPGSPNRDGIVCASELIGDPARIAGLQEFAPGFCWVPYEGETFHG